MYKSLVIIMLLFSVISCSPSQQEIQKQEQEYDRIADSVLKVADTSSVELPQVLETDSEAIHDTLK